MALKTKSMYEVFTNLVDWTSARTDKITDYSVGSAIRTLYEAVSIQLEEFYYAMKQNVMYAIENSVYDAFGFQRKEAVTASGYVTVYFEEPLPGDMKFPAGTVFSTGPSYNYMYFASTDDIYATVGTTEIMIPVECQTTGAVGNIPANTIDTIVTSNSIIKKVTNTTAITNGVDEETSFERKKRFQSYIKTLARGTRSAILYGCLDVDGVAGAYVDDSYIGYVKLYAHNNSGDLPDELRAAINQNMTEYRSAGIEVQVLPIVKHTIDIRLKVMIENDYDTERYAGLIKSLVWDSLEQYTVAHNFYQADLIHAIMAAYDDIVVNIEILEGSDTRVADNELVRPGEVNVTCVTVSEWSR